MLDVGTPVPKPVPGPVEVEIPAALPPFGFVFVGVVAIALGLMGLRGPEPGAAPGVSTPSAAPRPLVFVLLEGIAVDALPLCASAKVEGRASTAANAATGESFMVVSSFAEMGKIAMYS